ncbi:TrkA domain-containing protein [Helicobacter cinaedi]|uniref:TrkA domain-containing protein n=1 Tax=Helicobacter cinaedi TaxID=213 RepID=A0A377JQV9_9HELI|nr:TrkA C-terminal domain-containing protein [Helicobacter cinaedi]STP10370.1 TrkA domain-containing protein [Helicobacter cinaedi]
MKKTLVIAQGDMAKIFLDSILDKYFSNDYYIVVSKDMCFIPEKIPSSFEFHTFDYTSSFRISQVYNEEIYNIFLILDDESEILATYEILRELNKKTRIVTSLALEKHTQAMKDDKNLVVLNQRQIIANKFIERLPNVPLIPRSFGLGQGEIMEVGVPSGSIFAYRHIGSIQQRKWRIVGVYRRGELLLSSHSVVIQPNDSLLIVGDPKMLNDVYMQIKSDIGQFPAPFGRDIFLYVDMSLSNEHRIYNDVQNALFLNEKLKNNKLFIHILKPSNFDLLDKIRALESKSVEVRVDYTNANFREKIAKDSQKRFGLVIINQDIFASRRNRRALFELSIPVMKTGWEHIDECKKSFVVLSENMANTENVASVVFDISKQLNLEVDVYDYDTDGSYHNEIMQSYEELSRIYERKLNTIQTDSKNPISYIQDSFTPYLCFVPFERNIAKTKTFAFTSTDVHKIASMNNKNPQIFIPLPQKQGS